jgi:1-phosphatidylinositol phosphodiesterase
LEQNKGETIIMLVNAAVDGEDVAANFMWYLRDDVTNPYAILFRLTEQANPAILAPLGQLRGKIALLRRFTTNSPTPVLGVDLSAPPLPGTTNGWKDDATFKLITPSPAAVVFKIEDQYKQSDTGKKSKAVEDALNEAIQVPPDEIIHITYNSVAMAGHTPYQYAWGDTLGTVSPTMNKKTMRNYLNSHPGHRRFGVIMLDFYNDEGKAKDSDIVDSIINSNLV